MVLRRASSDFVDLTSGWEISVTMQLRTPLKWLRRHREFHAGAQWPEEALPMEHACWVPVPKTWRELGIDADEIPETTMASQIGQIPIDGGDFLPFLMEYRMLVEDGGGTLADLVNRYPNIETCYSHQRAERSRLLRSFQYQFVNTLKFQAAKTSFISTLNFTAAIAVAT